MAADWVGTRHAVSLLHSFDPPRRGDPTGISSELHRVRGIEEMYGMTEYNLIYRQRVALGAR